MATDSIQDRTATAHMNRASGVRGALRPTLNVYVFIEKNKTSGVLGIGKKSGENHGQLKVIPATESEGAKLVLYIPTRNKQVDLTDINLSEITRGTHEGKNYIIVNTPELGAIYIRPCNDMKKTIDETPCHTGLTLDMIVSFMRRTQHLASSVPSISDTLQQRRARDASAADELVAQRVDIVGLEEREKKEATEKSAKNLASLEARLAALKKGGKRKSRRKNKGSKRRRKTQKGGKRRRKTQKSKSRKSRKNHSKKKH